MMMDSEMIGLFSQVVLALIGVVLLALLTLYIIDVSQTKSAIRRNYPVIGRFRYLFEHLGEFFRQYFFAMDREEMPFNRALRGWVYRASKGVDTTVPFGSTRDLRPSGTLIFVNSAYPSLVRDAAPTRPITIGAGCPHPYVTDRLFHISAMSYGSLSKPAVQALSHGAKEAGCWLNTGEGGLSDWHLEGGADLVFQIGTAKFGVRNAEGGFDEQRLKQVASHSNVKMFEIKLSQGAKPGKGGILPAEKVNEEISRIRAVPIGEICLSPNRHIEVTDEKSLLEMIGYVRRITGKPVGIKFVLGDLDWWESLLDRVVQQGQESAPDFITLDSADGGSGAAPMSLIDYMGVPVIESLPPVVDCRDRHGLKDRIRINSSGKLITPAHLAWALCAGADLVSSARGFMFALGCIQALRCNLNTCPTGVTTHNKRLQKGLVPETKAKRVARYAQVMHKEVCVIAHSCGVHEPRELRRSHCRIVQPNGRSSPLSEVYPDVA